MALERTRKQFGFSTDVPDSVVLRDAYNRARERRPELTRQEFVMRVKKYEGQVPGPPPRDAASVPQTARPASGGGSAPSPLSAVRGVGNFLKTAAVEAGKDIAAIPQATVTDPLKRLAEIAGATAQGQKVGAPDPEMAERSRRAGAFMAGTAVGGPIAGLAKGLPMILRGGMAGAGAGAGDAAIRSGFDPRQTAAGAAFGGGLGLAGGTLARLIKGRTAPASASPEIVPPGRSSGVEPPVPGPVPREPVPGALFPEAAKPGQYGTTRAEIEAARREVPGGPPIRHEVGGLTVPGRPVDRAPSASMTNEQIAAMGADDIEALYRAQKEWEAGLERRALGPLYDEWVRLQRRANSSVDLAGADAASRRIEEMDAAFTPEQKKAIYGNANDDYISAEDLGDVAGEARRYRGAEAMSDDEIMESFASALSKPHLLDSAGGMHRISRLMGEAQRRGLNPDNPSMLRALSARGINPADADELSRVTMGRIREMQNRPTPLPAPAAEMGPSRRIPLFADVPPPPRTPPPPRPPAAAADGPPPPMPRLLEDFRGVNNPFSPVGNRLAAQGDEGKAVRSMLLAADDEGMVAAGSVMDDLEKAGVADPRGWVSKLLGKKGGLTPAQDRRISLARRGYLSPGALDPEEQVAFRAVSQYLDSVPARANAAGITVKTSEGTSHPIPVNENYLPGDVPPMRAIAPSRIGRKKPMREAIIQDLVDTGRQPNAESATRYVDDWIEFNRTRGRRGGDLVARQMVESGQAPDLVTAKGKLARLMSRSRVDRATNLEMAREIDTGISDPSVRRRLPAYAEETERRIAEANNLGAEMQLVDQKIGQVQDPAIRHQLAFLVKVAREAGDPEDAALKRASHVARQVGTLLLSPVSTIKNVGQVSNTLLRTDPGSTLRGLIAASTREGKSMALRSGSTTPAALRQSQHGVVDTGSFVDAYLKAIGFSRTERWLRRVAFNSARFYAEKHAKRAAGGNAFSAGELRRLRLNPDEVVARGGNLTEDEVLRAGKVGTDETQFRARPIDLPAEMTRTEIGRTASQFKSFMVQQTQLLKRETVDRIATGDKAQIARGVRNLVMLGSVYPMTGEAINSLVDLATGRTRDSEGIVRYLENLVTPGGAGIAADMIDAARRGNIPEYVAGPTVGRWGKNITTLYRAGERVAEGEDEAFTQSEKRNLWRQIPGAGPLTANRRFPSDE